MKKLVFTLVAFAAISMSMTSCFDSNKPAPEAEVVDILVSDSLTEETVAPTAAECADKDSATAATADDEKAPEAEAAEETLAEDK